MPETGELNLDHFNKRVQESFQVDAGDAGKAEATLVEAEATETARKIADGERKPFSLLFKLPKDVAFEQGICRVEHADVGSHDLFLVPVEEDDEGRYYEAVFT